jgi:hypothetical protein
MDIVDARSKPFIAGFQLAELRDMRAPRASVIASSLILLLLAAPARAQQPGADAERVLSGVVVDNLTGRPVSTALVSVGGDAPRAIADSLGAFTLRGVPAGTFEILVQRFGYGDLTLRVSVPGSPQPVIARLQNDPLQLDSLIVTGTARVDLAGAVLDARSREPVPWPSLWLSPDAVREAASSAGDEEGAFSLGGVRTGIYLLRIDKLGYRSQYISIGVSAPSAPITVLLEPDSAIMRGLAEMTAELRTRRNETPFQARVYDERRMHLTTSPDLRQFLDRETPLEWTTCPGGGATMDCLVHRLQVVRPRLFIDDFTRDIEDLVALAPAEIFQLETFTCSRSVEIRVYTTAYMESLARRPRILPLACAARE